ncbi:nuclease EXOG, mitochondrial-like isoform X2 [Amphiura filiformis]|uniref:nuclease EXOG, mitochondrial-like isoform X2 n=1 Tax=Amphiura filiformis TaxID=82378 RepID=UPI003B222861
MASSFRYAFGSGVATGSVASITLYSLYSYMIQPMMKQESAQCATQVQLKDMKPYGGRKDFTKYGVPDRGPNIRFYSNHALSYDQAKRIPVWVAEHITKYDSIGSANRRHSYFKADDNFPSIFAANNSDYKRSGWSRGHMAPAGNNKHDQEAMNDTFLLSNIVPQDIDNNGGFWNRFEIYCREHLPEHFEEVRVISGPLFLPSEGKDGKKYIKYQVIGDNNVAVPTHLYKVIVTEGALQSTQKGVTGPFAGAFIVPNEPIKSKEPLKQYQVPLMKLEKASGVQFFPKLSGHHLTDLCTVDSCDLISQDLLTLRFISRKMENATTVHRLEKSWQEFKNIDFKPDQKEIAFLTGVYEKKKKELEKKESGRSEL